MVILEGEAEGSFSRKWGRGSLLIINAMSVVTIGTVSFFATMWSRILKQSSD